MIVLFLVILTRIPFLFSGYGSDPDAWRVAATAKKLWMEGTYEPSRLPGYPLHEFLSAPLVGLGESTLSNIAVVGAMIALVIVWHRFLSDRNSRHLHVLTVALAFAPMLWKNSVVTMDYVWSLLCIVVALRSVFMRKALLAGIFIGLATGFRPTNIIAFVPVATALYGTSRSMHQLLRMGASTLVVCLAAFAPLFMSYGFGGWIAGMREATDDFHFSFIERILLFGYRGVYALGPLAVLAGGAILIRKWKVVQDAFLRRDVLVITSSVGIVIYCILFIAYPLEREYLIPAIVFLLLVIDAFASHKEVVVFTTCFISVAFINPDVIQHHGRRGTPGFNLRAGMLLDHVEKQNLMHHQRKALAVLQLTERSVVMTGSGPSLWFENEGLEKDTSALWQSLSEEVFRQKLNPDVHIIESLLLEEVIQLKAQGYDVYCMDVVQEQLEFVLGYTMEANGIRILAYP